MTGRQGRSVALGRARIGTVLLAVAMSALAGCRSADPGSVTLTIRIHYSRFEPSQLSAPHGIPVTFVLINEDPIEHEWLIGDAAFHERHRHGTEPHHGERPNEVSLPPLGTVETTLTFDRSGQIQYICHLPGHERYGMIGTLTIT